MSSETPPEGMAPMDPPPDEDAWEAYVDFTLKLLGADGSNAVPNATVAKLESALGRPLPFEIAILLLIGVPDGEGWHRWGDDPVAELAAWQASLAREVAVRSGVEVTGDDSNAAPLFPIYAGKAVPVGPAEGFDTADSNPIFAIDGGRVSVVANDLAAWLHAEFDMPLPWWPDTPDKRFAVWSDLAT